MHCLNLVDWVPPMTHISVMSKCTLHAWRYSQQVWIGSTWPVYVKRPPAPPAAGPTFGPHRRPVGPLVFLCLNHRSYVMFKHVVKAFAVVVRPSRRPAVTLFLSCGSRRFSTYCWNAAGILCSEPLFNLSAAASNATISVHVTTIASLAGGTGYYSAHCLICIGLLR